MAQRAALARALVNDPRILILDEPLGKLDSLTRIAMQSELVDLWQRAGFTSLLVTHDVEEALFMATRIVVLSERPARIKDEIVNDLPYPRHRGDPKLAALRHRALALLGLTRRGEYRGDGAGGRGASGHAGLVARRPGGHRRGGRARLAWASAWTLAGVAGLVALGWSRAQGLPGLLGSRAGHLALASARGAGIGPGRRMAVAARGGYGFPWRQAGASRRGAGRRRAGLAGAAAGAGFRLAGASRWRWPIGPCLAL